MSLLWLKRDGLNGSYQRLHALGLGRNVRHLDLRFR